MDASAEKTDDHAIRIAALETDATQLRSSLKTLQWLGGAIVALATIFGDKLLQLFS
jgi:hypothetical protein